MQHPVPEVTRAERNNTMQSIDLFRFFVVQAVMACTDEGLLDLIQKLIILEQEGGEIT